MSDKTVAIIPCTNQKSETGGPAREVWIGSHFQLILAHTEMFYDEVFIMSYKYGLIGPDFTIEPYDIDIRVSSAAEKLKWWYNLRKQIRELCETEPLLVSLYTGDFERDRIIREFVRCGVRQVLIPFKGKSIGQRMAEVWDMEEPFNLEKAKAHAYDLPASYGENIEKGQGNKYLPPPTALEGPIEWE